MIFEIKIQDNNYEYELLMPSLILRLKKEGELAQKQITLVDFIDWKIRNFVKPIGEAPILTLAIFEQDHFAPYYSSIMETIEEFSESYNKLVHKIPK